SRRSRARRTWDHPAGLRYPSRPSAQLPPKACGSGRGSAIAAPLPAASSFHSCRSVPRGQERSGLNAQGRSALVGRPPVRQLHQSVLLYVGLVETLSLTVPPSFVRLAGHPLRWRLLGELARSDRRVAELVSLVGHPQNLVSYHLRRLRAERL